MGTPGDFVLFSQSDRLIGCTHYGRDSDGSWRRPRVRAQPAAFDRHVGPEGLALVVVAGTDCNGDRSSSLDPDLGDGCKTNQSGSGFVEVPDPAASTTTLRWTTSG